MNSLLKLSELDEETKNELIRDYSIRTKLIEFLEEIYKNFENKEKLKEIAEKYNFKVIEITESTLLLKDLYDNEMRIEFHENLKSMQVLLNDYEIFDKFFVI